MVNECKEYQFTIKRSIVVLANVSVEARSEELAIDLAMSGQFSMCEEWKRLEEYTESIVSLDAIGEY